MIHKDAKIYKDVDIRESTVGRNSTIGDFSIILNSNIKDYVAINRRNVIQHSTVSEFTYTGSNTIVKYASVGRFCSISWNVSIGGKNHKTSNVTSHSRWWFTKLHSGKSEKPTEYRDSDPCQIGNDVWIASNVVVLRNVKVGDGSAIGAGAVVTKDVEPYTIVAGVPAKPIKKRFDDDIINALEDLAWWNWPVEVIKKNLDLIYSTKVDDSVIMKLKKIKKEL